MILKPDVIKTSTPRMKERQRSSDIFIPRSDIMVSNPSDLHRFSGIPFFLLHWLDTLPLWSLLSCFSSFCYILRDFTTCSHVRAGVRTSRGALTVWVFRGLLCLGAVHVLHGWVIVKSWYTVSRKLINLCDKMYDTTMHIQ